MTTKISYDIMKKIDLTNYLNNQSYPIVRY